MTNLVFFGSSEHSVVILKKLLEIKEFNIIAVVTKTDKAVGRDQIISQNPTAKFAKENNLTLFQPENFDHDFVEKFKSLNPDMGLVVAYGPPYFTQEMIDIPKFKVVNIHPSPLPKYRGATPGPWQIINGETKTSVTFFQIDALPDHGPIIAQISFEINENETSTTFYKKAFDLASDNLESVLKNYINNPNSLTIQDHSQKTYFPKFTKESAKINWTWNNHKINRFINALNPWPIAWTYVSNQQSQQLKMKIYSSSVISNQLIPKLIQIEGKKITNWEEVNKYYTVIKD